MPSALTTPRLFQEEPLYAGAPSTSSDVAWETLIPKGRGFVQVNISGRQGRYCVSAFHQLHCLDMLRHGYYAATNLGRRKHDYTSADTLRRSLHDDHVQHCFDYLRQALMCSADPTLELRNASIGGVTGWGSMHQCRDFGALQLWTESNRYSDEGGILN
ncbi:hypothetical protein F5B22DRAFT_644412 [Xylaria bambusicola]|uniref:uncharacterized protein n=1 Tax=Xylaria bambusicola TaxID=326684 RepID=UPI00200736F0|nr:uncharacterized protein F5B22DRAFT_644412 [Xylaria bambusicola]KAI0521164.1 hypothetical protein F5B22DRAFT_644412 [Xylaria bambusicola]